MGTRSQAAMGWASLRELHWLLGDGFLRWAFIITILGRSWRNCRPIRSMDLWSPLPPSGGSNMNTSNVALLLSCFWPYITIPTAPVFFTQTYVNFWASHAVEPHGGRRCGQQHAIDEPGPCSWTQQRQRHQRLPAAREGFTGWCATEARK